jgi:hypothetical protein
VAACSAKLFEVIHGSASAGGFLVSPATFAQAAKGTAAGKEIFHVDDVDD